MTLSACTDVATPTPIPTPTVTPVLTPTPEPVYDVEAARAELAAAKALWESKGSDHYTIEYDAFPYPLRVPARLTVRNGVIESATFLEGRDSGMPVPPNDMRGVLTIDGLFDKIEEVLSDPPAWNMGAEYDAELGYPREFGVSYTDTPDNYFAASICCYKPLDHPPPTVAPKLAPAGRADPHADDLAHPHAHSPTDPHAHRRAYLHAHGLAHPHAHSPTDPHAHRRAYLHAHSHANLYAYCCTNPTFGLVGG